MRNMSNGQRVPFLMIACWAVSLSSAYGPATSWRLMTFKLKGSTNKIAWSREIPAVLESQHYAATSLPAANHTENHLESILDWCRLVAGKTEWQWEPGRLKRWHKTDPEVVWSKCPLYLEFLQASCNLQCTRDLPIEKQLNWHYDVQEIVVKRTLQNLFHNN